VTGDTRLITRIIRVDEIRDTIIITIALTAWRNVSIISKFFP
jgi:hypothetical protein